MAYNPRNLLLRIIEIQEIYLKWQAVGLNNRTIFLKHIKPIYWISERTFYHYLARNAKKELKELTQ